MCRSLKDGVCLLPRRSDFSLSFMRLDKLPSRFRYLPILHHQECHRRVIERAYIYIYGIYVNSSQAASIHTVERGRKRKGVRAQRRLKHRSPPGWEPSFELSFIGASNSHSSSSQTDNDDWIYVHTCDASLFLSSCSSCCSTHLHISACYPSLWAFYFACGFTIFLLLPFLTWTLLFLLFSSSSRNGFRFGLGRALLVFETEHYFFFSRKLKALPRGCAESERNGRRRNKTKQKELFCLTLSSFKKFSAPVESNKKIIFSRSSKKRVKWNIRRI